MDQNDLQRQAPGREAAMEGAALVAPPSAQGPSAEGAAGGQERRGPLRRYLRDSSGLGSSLLLVLPLFVIYQIGVLGTGGVQNGVDFVTPWLFHKVFGGVTLYYVLFNVGVLVFLGGGLVLLKGMRRFDPWMYLWVFAESTVYGLLLGGLVSGVLQRLGVASSLQVNGGLPESGLPESGLPESGLAGAKLGAVDYFVLSLGAGFYEELVFRLLLLGGSAWVLRGFFRLDQAVKLRASGGWAQGQGMGSGEILWASLFGDRAGRPAVPPLRWWTSCAVVVGVLLVTSVLFSAIHYIGPLGDPWSLYSFLFRLLAGMLFAGLYATRGFAVAVYTHAIYDVIVLVF